MNFESTTPSKTIDKILDVAVSAAEFALGTGFSFQETAHLIETRQVPTIWLDKMIFIPMTTYERWVISGPEYVH